MKYKIGKFKAENATALGQSLTLKVKPIGLIWGDIIRLRSIDSNLLLLYSVGKTENWKEAEGGFVPVLETREAGLQVI